MEKTINDIAQEQLDEERTTAPKIDGSEPGQYRVVRDLDLENLTYHGSARLVRVLDRTVLHKERREVRDPQGYSRGTEEVSQWGPGQAFLIFTPIAAQQLEQQLASVREELNRAASAAVYEKSQRAGEIQKLESLLALVKQELDQAKSDVRVAVAAKDDAQIRARKMETDLAKVRKDIGEAAWKRILAGGE